MKNDNSTSLAQRLPHRKQLAAPVNGLQQKQTGSASINLSTLFLSARRVFHSASFSGIRRPTLVRFRTARNSQQLRLCHRFTTTVATTTAAKVPLPTSVRVITRQHRGVHRKEKRFVPIIQPPPARLQLLTTTSSRRVNSRSHFEEKNLLFSTRTPLANLHRHIRFRSARAWHHGQTNTTNTQARND